MASSPHQLGIVVTSYHSSRDLQDFCNSLLRYPPSMPWWANIQLVEVTEEENKIAMTFTEALSAPAICAGTTNHVNNCGYARACNDGARWLDMVSDGSVDTYAFFNADIEITEGALDHCVETLWSNNRYGILGPRQVDQNGRITHAGIFGELKHPMHRGWHELSADKYMDIRDDCVTISGSAYFVKAPVWDHLSSCSLYREIDPDSQGAFLQTPHYYEETFCSYHAHAHDYKVVYDGGATIVHKWQGASPTEADKQVVRTKFFESQKIFRAACDHHGIEHD